MRWTYLFADHICKEINIDLIPGKHLPYNADVSTKQKDDGNVGNESANRKRNNEGDNEVEWTQWHKSRKQ